MRQTPTSVRTIATAFPSLISPRQQEWESLWEVDTAPPGKVTSYKLYTVPSGYRLLFKGGFAFCDIGTVQKAWLTKSPGILGSFYFSRIGTFSFEPSSEALAGHDITAYLFNYSTKKCYMGVSLVGILEKV